MWTQFAPHDDCRRIRSTILKLTKQTPQRLIRPILINIDNFFKQWRHCVVVTVEKVISIYQISRSQRAIESVWPVFKLSIESVGSRRELVANSCTHRRRRRDATRQFRLVGVGGVYWALQTWSSPNSSSRLGRWCQSRLQFCRSGCLTTRQQGGVQPHLLIIRRTSWWSWLLQVPSHTSLPLGSRSTSANALSPLGRSRAWTEL